MTIRVAPSGVIVLEGACSSEDAETLLQQLLANPDATVDWRSCEGAHTAVIQVLMAAKPALLGPPSDPRLRRWVASLLTRRPA